MLSTEFRTDPRQPPLVPLFLLARSRPWPTGCLPNCLSLWHDDHLLVSDIADLEKAVSDGFRLLGRQGYVFARCAPEPACMPAGAERLYRLCNTSRDDCANFLESERSLFEGQGFTVAYPANSNPVLGYAFPNIDADGDSLIDGFERMLGTRSDIADSDGDGTSDGIEYPLAGVPVSDPCDGPAVVCSGSVVFFDGFGE